VVSLIGAVCYVVWATLVDPISPGVLSSSDAPFPSGIFNRCSVLCGVGYSSWPHLTWLIIIQWCPISKSVHLFM